MAQKTFVAGDVLTAADVNTYLMGEGGAWSTWTPSVTQSGAVTVTVNRASYGRWGRLIVASGFLTVTGSGTGNNVVQIGNLPVAAAYSTGVIGTGAISDLSATRTYIGLTALISTTAFRFLGATIAADIQLGLTGSGFDAGLANTDQISFTLMYQAAS